MPGSPFYSHQATEQQKLKVYRQVANCMSELRRVPKTQAGSLLHRHDDFEMGPIASDRFARLGKHGPYSQQLDYFESIAEQHMELIADGQLHPEYPKEAFLFYHLLRHRAAPILAKQMERFDGFFLKHVDDKGDHLLVDADYNLTGIVDWQFARFVPACEAFGPSLITADVGSLYSSAISLSVDDKQLLNLLKGQDSGKFDALGDIDELSRRFNFGLASGLSKSEAELMI